jgi:hypothetical protein
MLYKVLIEFWKGLLVKTSENVLTSFAASDKSERELLSEMFRRLG